MLYTYIYLFFIFLAFLFAFSYAIIYNTLIIIHFTMWHKCPNSYWGHIFTPVGWCKTYMEHMIWILHCFAWCSWEAGYFLYDDDHQCCFFLLSCYSVCEGVVLAETCRGRCTLCCSLQPEGKGLSMFSCRGFRWGCVRNKVWKIKMCGTGCLGVFW